MRRILYLALFLLPFISVTTQLHPEEYNYEAYFAAVAFCYVVLLIVRGIRMPAGPEILFMGWICVSAILYIGLDVLLSAPGQYYSAFVFPLGAFSLFFLLSTSPDLRDPDFFLTMLLALAAAEALLVIMQSILSFPDFALRPDSIFVYERGYLGYFFPDVFPKLVRSGTGTYEHFNGAGALLSLVFPLSFALWSMEKKNVGKLLVALVIFAGIFFTYSRGALLGSAVGILVFFFYSGTGNRGRLFRRAVLVVIAFAAVGGIQLVLSYYAETENLTPRSMIWEVALGYARSNPQRLLLGMGFQFFSDFLGSHLSGTSLRRLHSGFLQILLELGVVGLALFAMALKRFIGDAARSRGLIAVSIAAGGCAFMFHEIFDNSLFGYNGMIFFSLMAISGRLLSQRQSEQDGNHARRNRFSRAAASPIGEGDRDP